MKYLFICLFFISFYVSSQNLESKSAKASFEVSGVCDMCKSRIENGAIKLKGVKYAKWDIPSNNLSIIYNSKKIKLDSIKKNEYAKSLEQVKKLKLSKFGTFTIRKKKYYRERLDGLIPMI